MKKSELKQIIKEEIKNILKEETAHELEQYSDQYLINLAEDEGIEKMIVLDGEGGLANRDEIIQALANINETSSLNENISNYMFFQNLKTIKDEIDEMLTYDPMMMDAILNDDHNWASDHIATSKDDIEEVYKLFKAEMRIVKELKGGQKRIAAAAEPKDKITGADFRALQAMKKK
jgi:hypothetical protein